MTKVNRSITDSPNNIYRALTSNNCMRAGPVGCCKGDGAVPPGKEYCAGNCAPTRGDGYKIEER